MVSAIKQPDHQCEKGHKLQLIHRVPLKLNPAVFDSYPCCSCNKTKMKVADGIWVCSVDGYNEVEDAKCYDVHHNSCIKNNILIDKAFSVASLTETKLLS
jgi:ribosomal protein L37AE/L43A